MSITTSIEFQMSLLLFVALLGYLVASRINQSAVIGEILVGIIVGPSILGLIEYDAFVEGLAHLGAVVLLFVIGLEFKVKEIYNIPNSVIGFLGVVVPWVGGFLLADYFGFPFHTSLFIGVAMTATSIAITANVLKEMGRLDTNVAKIIVGAAVIDDVLGLIALSITIQIVDLGTVNYGSIILVGLKAVLFLLICSLLGHHVFRRWIENLDKADITKTYPEFVFIFAMMVAFAYSMAAEFVGLSAIIGAFIAGVSMGGINLIHSKDLKNGAEYLHIIFAAIFFVSLGIIVNLHAVTSRIILFTALLTLVAILTKVVGCSAGGKIFKLSTRDSLIVGFGMSPRAEVAMIIALIGLTKGIITQDVYVAIIMVSLLTTVITPIVLRNWSFK